MVIAALETATRAGSVALAIDDTCVAACGNAARPHGDRLPAELLQWIETHGRGVPDVDLFAVVSGPGSFTGLRVGIATIQGLALATGRQVVGIPTLDAIAEGSLATDNDASTVLVACLDGQRGEVFAAAWDAAGSASIDECRPLLDAAAYTPEALALVLAALGRPSQITIVGDGALRYAPIFGRAVPTARTVGLTVPLAEMAARLAGRRLDRAGPPHALRPIYLRQPDAARPRERAHRPAYTIRRLDSREDLSAIEALQRQTFANPWGADAIRWELENTDVARLYVMRDAEGTDVAYCACWMVFDEVHINSLAVDASVRRRGLGRRLIEHILTETARDGATAATLEVRTSNHAARALYDRLGFVVEGVRRDYYQDPREDAIILWKRGLGG